MKRIAVPIMVVLMLVLALPVAAQAPVNPGTGGVNFTVMNMDPVDAADVIVDYIAPNGVVAATKSVSIDALSSEGFPIDQSGLPDSWSGSVIVSGSKPMVAFAQVLWQGGNYGDGRTAGAYNGFNEGANKLYYPSLAARPSQFSRLTVQSAASPSSTESIAITIKYYDRTGALSKTVNDTLLLGTQKTYDLLSAGLPVTNPPGDGWLGSAVVESSAPIAGVATMHWQQYSAAYSAVAGGGTKAFLPSATRRVASGEWQQYTAVVVQNLDLSTPAQVTVRWYNRSGNLLYSFNDTVAANSSKGYNTRFTTSDVPNSAALHTALGNDWNGSVVVESTNGIDIVAVANLQWTDASGPGLSASAYTSDANGYDEIFVPATFRRVGTSWIQFTGLIVQNVGASACNNFTVQWRDRDGNLLLNYTDSLAPNISHGYNTRFGAAGSEFPASAVVENLGDDFRGSVYFDAPGCELIAIHNTLWPLWTDSTTYNAFGQ